MPTVQPPLTALRAFDAAARHMSFAKAAAELGVTPAALSFQIKSLEENLGLPLFRRLNRAVELTEAGTMLAEGVAPGWREIESAWLAARQRAESRSLNVTAGPALTAKWLAPRLFNFVSRNPEIDLRFSATLRLMDLDRDNVDVAIRFGVPGEADEGHFSKPLMREWVTPMMRPDLAERFGTPESLSDAPLLHQDDLAFLKPGLGWPDWFRAAGLGEAPRSGARFSQADHALDAALAGGGVVLGRISLAERDLREGRLVAPFDLALTTEARYRIICATGAEKRRDVADFLDWLEGEVVPFEPYEKGRRMVPAGSVTG